MRVTKLDDVMDKILNRENYRFTYFDRERQLHICISPVTELEGEGATPEAAALSLQQQLVDMKLGPKVCSIKLTARRVTVTERRSIRAIALLEEMAKFWDVKPYEALEILIFSNYAQMNQLENDSALFDLPDFAEPTSTSDTNEANEVS